MRVFCGFLISGLFLISAAAQAQVGWFILGALAEKASQTNEKSEFGVYVPTPEPDVEAPFQLELMRTGVEGNYFRTDTYFFVPAADGNNTRVSVSFIQPRSKSRIPADQYRYQDLMRHLRRNEKTTRDEFPVASALLKNQFLGKLVYWEQMPELFKDVFRKNPKTSEITLLYGDFLMGDSSPFTVRVPEDGAVVFLNFRSDQTVSTFGKGMTVVDLGSGSTVSPTFSTEKLIQVQSGRSQMPALTPSEPSVSTLMTNSNQKPDIKIKSFGIFHKSDIPLNTNLCTYIKSNRDAQAFQIDGEEFVVNSKYGGYVSGDGEVPSRVCTLNHTYSCDQLALEKDGLSCDGMKIAFNGIPKSKDDPIDVCQSLVANYTGINGASEKGTLKYGRCSFDFAVEQVNVSFYKAGCFIRPDSRSIHVPENLKEEISEITKAEARSESFGSYQYPSNGCTHLFLSSRGLVCVASNGHIYNLRWNSKCD